MEQFKLGPLQEQWLTSLEQHPERQMTGRLGRMKSDGTYQACCLGEAGLILDVCEWREDDLTEGEQILCVKGYGFTGSYSILTNKSYESMGFRDPWGATDRGDKDNTYKLATLNDHGKTWPEIAAIVREAPEKYFTHSV